MDDITSQVGKPWPSLDCASFWFDRASWLLAASLIAGAISTIAIVWLGTIKERHWDILREDSGKVVAALQLETSKANEGTAIANAKAKALEFQIEQLRILTRPRSLYDTDFRKLVSEGAKEPVQLYFLQDDGETFNLASQIRGILQFAGWTVSGPMPLTSDTSTRLSRQPFAKDTPLALLASAQVRGVSIVVKKIDPKIGIPGQRDNAASVLWNAFMKSLGGVSGGNDETMPEGVIRLVVASK